MRSPHEKFPCDGRKQPSCAIAASSSEVSCATCSISIDVSRLSDRALGLHLSPPINTSFWVHRVTQRKLASQLRLAKEKTGFLVSRTS